jgi:tetratricopeptide (TPR) repeat protein
MASISDPKVLKRFIIYLALLTFVMFGVWSFWGTFVETPAGDFEVRAGDIHLSGGEFADAIEDFNEALKVQPNHRGALLGKAAALMQMKRFDEAEKVLNHTIDFLTANLDPDDPTGRGALAAAYGNRGILHDRQARYEQALADYIQSLKVDAEAVEGPGVIQRLLYHDEKPSSIRDRAEYLYKQLQLPEEKRLLRLPEKDEQQRMYKP